MVMIPIHPMEPIDFSKLDAEKHAQGVGNSAGLPFGDILRDASEALEAAQAVTKSDSYHLALGDVDNLAQLQINSMKAETMLNTTIQITTRVVNAYKEIMQMPV